MGLSIIAGNMTGNHIVQYGVLCLLIAVLRIVGIMSTWRDNKKLSEGCVLQLHLIQKEKGIRGRGKSRSKGREVSHTPTSPHALGTVS